MDVFLQKLDSYAQKLGRKDPYLPIYRRLRIRPLMYWHPVIQFAFFTLVGCFVFTFVFSMAALFINSSKQVFVVFYDFLIMPELVGMSLLFAFCFTIMSYFLRLRSNLSNWDSL